MKSPNPNLTHSLPNSETKPTISPEESYNPPVINPLILWTLKQACNKLKDCIIEDEEVRQMELSNEVRREIERKEMEEERKAMEDWKREKREEDMRGVQRENEEREWEREMEEREASALGGEGADQ